MGRFRSAVTTAGMKAPISRKRGSGRSDGITAGPPQNYRFGIVTYYRLLLIQLSMQWPNGKPEAESSRQDMSKYRQLRNPKRGLQIEQAANAVQKRQMIAVRRPGKTARRAHNAFGLPVVWYACGSSYHRHCGVS